MDIHTTRNQRLLLMAAGFITLSLSLIGPKSVWGLLGLIPFMTGLFGGQPMFRIFGLTAQRAAARTPSRSH
jgi:hypothetical protein